MCRWHCYRVTVNNRQESRCVEVRFFVVLVSVGLSGGLQWVSAFNCWVSAFNCCFTSVSAAEF